jgi:hypothetical protein
MQTTADGADSLAMFDGVKNVHRFCVVPLSALPAQLTFKHRLIIVLASSINGHSMHGMCV